MPWTPTHNNLDPRKPVDNFFTYVAANQSDALAWANDNAVPALTAYQDFHKSVAGRLTTIFPCLLVVRQESAAEYGDDIAGAFRLTLESMHESGDSAQLVTDAKKYALALESLILNCPKTTWFQNSKITLIADVTAIETEFDVMLGDGSQFLQVFSTRFILNVRGRSYG